MYMYCTFHCHGRSFTARVDRGADGDGLRGLKIDMLMLT